MEQAVRSSGGSSRLPTTAAWVADRVRSCGICGVQSGTTVSLAKHLIDCSTLIIIHHHAGWWNFASNRGLGSVPPQKGKKINCMELNTTGEAISCVATRQFPSILCNPKGKCTYKKTFMV
jgi:hypothetical protein